MRKWGAEMKWIVFVHDINRDQIKTFNVFDHGGFKKDILSHLEKCKTRDGFAEAARRSLSYYFRCKSEWEILISPWLGCRKTEPVKIDVYQQVMNNWDIFVDYLWTQ